jgi:CRP/FNR family transcriptional regulator
MSPVIPLYRLDERHPQAQACTVCGLRGLALFGALRDEDLDRLHVDIAQMQRDAGTRLYDAGARGAAVYTLRSGIVRFERVNERGERRIVRLAGSGDLLGQEVLLGHAYADDAVACTAVELCRIPTAVVADLGELQPALLRELMRRWQRAFEDSQGWMAELTNGPARRRVLKLLDKLGQYGEPGQPVWLPPRGEIGAMLNLTVETASRQISQLRRDGVLVTEGWRRAWVDRVRLQRALQCQDRS